MLTFIIVFLVTLCLINAASMRLQDTKWFKKEDGTIAKRLLFEGGGVALATALVNRLAPVLENTWWNVFLLGAMAAGFTGLFLWWGDKDEGGTDFKDAIPFVLLGLMFALVAGGPANSLASLVGVPGLSGVIKYLPRLAFIALLGYMAVVALLYHRDIHRDAGEPHRKFFVAAIATLVIFGLLFVSSLGKAIGTPVVSTRVQISETNQSNWAEQWKTAIFGNSSDESSSGGRTLTEFFKSLFGKNDEDGSKSEQPGGDAQPTQPATTEESAPKMWDVHFYHDDVTRNDIEEDDDNFGTSILDQLLLEKVQAGEIRLTDIGKDPKELIKLVTAEEYFSAVIKRMGKDPALGAAWLGTYDAYMGSDYLGKFSTELKDHPDARMELINGGVDAWCYDQSGYYDTLIAFISAIEDADEVYLDYYASGLDDQMYMDGHTVDDIPNVVVMTSENHSGIVLVVKNRIKNSDTVVTMLFRDDCGGQPTNVAKKLGVTPKQNPRSTPAPSSGGGKSSSSSGGKSDAGSSGGKSSGGSSGGKSGNDPKNINEGITHVNDNPTVNNDPFTGNTTGYSTAELPTNSVYADDIRDLLDEVDELEEANDDSPDYYVGLTEDTTVDTNRATGTGNGGADTATNVSGAITGVRGDNGAKDTVDGKVGGAGASWGGPPR